MRYDKALYAPEEGFTSEHVDLCNIGKGQRVTLYHMRPTESGLVCGEGSKAIAALSSAASRIYATDGGVYAYLSAEGALYDVNTRTKIAGIETEPNALLPQTTEAGVKGLYCVEKNVVRYLRSGAVQSSSQVGGTCAAMHHGRLFAASGNVLRFSGPFSTEGLTQTGKDPDKAGYIEFEDGKGPILAVVSFRDKLILFRERGIIKMRAEGEAIDFSATEMPFQGGRIVEGSVAECGDRICYLTMDGLFAFDGNSCEFLEKEEAINLNFAVTGFNFKGKYAAAVSLTSGRKGVYVFDFTRGKGRFLLEKGILSGARENFLAGTSVYTITDQGGMPVGYDCSVEIGFATPPRALARVSVEGDGTFEVRTNASSAPYTLTGGGTAEIGAKKKLTETLVTITVKSSDFRLRGVDIVWRKENGY